ncbi:predicted protein [Sclerotinia sclerotiorum 1980 UF-70]|uniref:Uncharacterized protein n=1 Tax=Sclerotinia sclerotiorum (strain ATCC 18683 / 1980 / Ss-1) TaxID=665079 RepID=A7F130_SCLS1|nr:predicted protein [Sclerotinia sclerotiorum 1980 UF-70]EDN95422.1 predicted protein [Sclerotinia sclerotiorum 1980 UF-70]
MYTELNTEHGTHDQPKRTDDMDSFKDGVVRPRDKFGFVAPSWNYHSNEAGTAENNHGTTLADRHLIGSYRGAARDFSQVQDSRRSTSSTKEDGLI